MLRVIFLLIILGLVWVIFQKSPVGNGVKESNDKVVLSTGDFEVTYSKVRSAEGSYMVFGGTGIPHKNATSHVMLASLPMRNAQQISRSYPDFHLCASPGAGLAKELIQHHQLIGLSRNEKGKLVKVVDLHDERIRGNGERTCMRFSGEELRLESMILKNNGEDWTQRLKEKMQKDQTFYLARQVEIINCEDALKMR